MRKTFAVLTMAALSGCGGGTGGNTPPAPSTPAVTTPLSNAISSQFVIVVPPRSASSGTRRPSFVSSATQSITITLTTVGGNPVTPSSVTANVSGASCTTASPCTIEGPPSPAGQIAQFTLTTYDGPNGVTGNTALDTATAQLTPVQGMANTVAVTMKGIPFSIAITGVPAGLSAGVANQNATLTVTVNDRSGQAITGTYANPVTITAHDGDVNGTTISGTHPVACVNSFCVRLDASTDAITFKYNGLAENAVSLTSASSGVLGGSAGTATFTPVLQPIVWVAGPTSSVAGTPKGIDLYTTDSSSPVGYRGTESYSEPGYTQSPYNKTLTTIDGSSCAAFAAGSVVNGAGGTTDFTYNAIASPTAGVCTRVVSDGLVGAGHATGGPSFVVTYTTATFGAGKARHQ